MNTGSKYMVLVALAAVAAGAVFLMSNFSHSTTQPVAAVTDKVPVSFEAIRGEPAFGQVAGAATEDPFEIPQLLMPISIGLDRVTKKTFGLKVSPNHSPVEHEIFSGYHTGIDFEILASEQNTNIAITAACNGKVILKTWAKGYGGVLVQACQLDGEDVTVIYGHMKLDSISAKVGQTFLAGDTIGYLGDGFTKETDGRRKHLHFDIHKGSELDIHGYVPEKDDLANWIDPTQYLE